MRFRQEPRLPRDVHIGARCDRPESPKAPVCAFGAGRGEVPSIRPPKGPVDRRGGRGAEGCASFACSLTLSAGAPRDDLAPPRTSAFAREAIGFLAPLPAIATSPGIDPFPTEGRPSERMEISMTTARPDHQACSPESPPLSPARSAAPAGPRSSSRSTGLPAPRCPRAKLPARHRSDLRRSARRAC